MVLVCERPCFGVFASNLKEDAKQAAAEPFN